jgi:hypothetical protein
MRKFLLALALTLAAGAAQADGTLYLGAGITNDNVRDIAATNSNLNSTDWKVWAGFRPVSPFAIEADYMDLGSENVAGTHLAYKAFAGYAVGYVPIPLPYLDVFGKVGLARWTQSGSSSGGLFSLSDNGTEFAWGVGTQVHFGNLGARLEFENFSIRNTNGANLVSLSVFLNLL